MKEHITSLATLRRMMIRRFAALPEPVEWEDSLADEVYTVSAKWPVTLHNIACRLEERL
jgi:hypothetical protein